MNGLNVSRCTSCGAGMQSGRTHVCPKDTDHLRRAADWPKVGEVTQLQPGEEAAGPNPIYYLNVPGYETLAGVLRQAYGQAASGKGAERHAQGQPFDQQPMQQLIKLYGPGFALGQAAKKAQESQRLPKDRAIAELLGAINYLAGAVIALENAPSTTERNV